MNSVGDLFVEEHNIISLTLFICLAINHLTVNIKQYGMGGSSTQGKQVAWAELVIMTNNIYYGGGHFNIQGLKHGYLQ